jgi:dTDP-glucose 4,6-dehydratase
MRIVVTGGAGFIGSSFINYLLDHYEAEVVCVDKMTYCANKDNIKHKVEFIEKDICDITQDDLGSYDYLVNFAAESHVDNSISNGMPFIKSNIEGTFNLLEVARKNPNLIKFIQISTDEVYGDMYDYGANVEADETFPLKASSYYSASKAAADLLVQACHRTYGLPYLITRTCNNFGEHQHPEKFLPKIYKSIKEEKEIPLYGDGEHVREWIHVDDNARYITLLMFSDIINDVVNIGSGIKYSNVRIINIIREKIGGKGIKFKQVPDRLGHDKRYSLNSKKLKELLTKIGQVTRTTHILDYFEKLYRPKKEKIRC